MGNRSVVSVQQEAYDLGSAGFFRRARNPYKDGSELATDWQKGYDYAEHSDAVASGNVNLLSFDAVSKLCN